MTPAISQPMSKQESVLTLQKTKPEKSGEEEEKQKVTRKDKKAAWCVFPGTLIMKISHSEITAKPNSVSKTDYFCDSHSEKVKKFKNQSMKIETFTFAFDKLWILKLFF